VYELLESNTPEPRLELFARHKREGWDCWGNEVDSDINLELGSLKIGDLTIKLDMSDILFLIS
ncbi:hypothetical protein LCGC14_2877400, partial [marine sediment metagenome]